MLLCDEEFIVIIIILLLHIFKCILIKSWRSLQICIGAYWYAIAGPIFRHENKKGTRSLLTTIYQNASCTPNLKSFLVSEFERTWHSWLPPGLSECSFPDVCLGWLDINSLPLLPQLIYPINKYLKGRKMGVVMQKWVWPSTLYLEPPVHGPNYWRATMGSICCQKLSVFLWNVLCHRITLMNIIPRLYYTGVWT